MFNTTKNGADAPPDESLDGLSEQELYQAGAAHFKNRNYSSARACFERCLEQNPDSAATCHFLARVYFHQDKDLDKAEECLKKALELDHSATTQYLETLGMIYLHQGRFSRAEEVFEYALSEDKKDDTRHTYSLEFYLNLARKKHGAWSKGRRQKESLIPEFLAADMGRWHTGNRQAVFLLPSILLHAVIFLLVGYLSTHNLPFKKQKEDFTYVEIGQPAPEPEKAAPAKNAEAPAARQTAERTPAPSPVSPGKEVRTADVRKEGAAAAAPAQAVESRPSGARGAVGQKSAASIRGAKSETLMTQAMPGDKGSQIKPRSLAMPGGEVDLVKKDLAAEISGSKSAGGPKEAALRDVSDRSGEAARAEEGGIVLGNEKTGKPAKWDKERRTRLEGGSTESMSAFKAAGGEKSLDIGRVKEKLFASNEQAELAARRLDIGAGPSTRAVSNTGANAPRGLEKREAAAAGASAGQAAAYWAGPSSSMTAGTGGKARADMGDAAPSGTVNPAAAGRTGERRDMLSLPGGRRFASEEGVPLRRSISVRDGGMSGAAAPAGGAGEKIASLDQRTISGAPAAQAIGASGLTAVRPGADGFKAGAGKGVNSRALATRPVGDGAAAGLGGLLEKTARRFTDALGLGGARASGSSGPSGADLRRGNGLAGLAGGGGYPESGGPGPGGSAAGSGGVRLGSGEKGVALPRTAKAGGSGPGGRATAGVVGDKKMTEGAIGTPGGAREDRYASAGISGAHPAGVEKRSAVERSRAYAKNMLGPEVRITSPAPGNTNRVTQVITGRVSDSRINSVILTVNNESRVISVEKGRFETTLSIGKGKNKITVTATDMDGNMGKDIVVLDYVKPSQSVPVTLSTPKEGQVFEVSERSVISVKGAIGDPEIKKAKLILNGNPKDIIVNRGFFEQRVALTEERNTILVEAVGADGTVSRSSLVTVNTMNVKPKDIMLILTWDKPHADFDLHIYGPTGGHTFYKSPNIYESREAIAGAQLEQDAKDNYGPEVYTQEHAEKGVYTVKSNYYYSAGDGPAHATLTVILYGDNPARRIVRVFGPHLQSDTKDGSDWWEVTRIKMPDGIFLED